MLKKLYKMLWSRIGGRQWSFIARDFWHNYEGLCILGLVAGGAVACHFFGLLWVLIALGIFMLGYVAGHLFWGKEWIEGEK